MEDNKILLGCIADDFTGASDAASFLHKVGLKVVLFNGIPIESIHVEGAEAIVIALKTRTMPVKEAVKQSVDAIQWLKRKGANRFYSKYCSTFDSTEEGNIGPIADAIMELLNIKYTLLCSALPINGRVVREGELYVNGVLLEESPMRNHPLTPMKKSSIKDLIEVQSDYKAYNIGRKLIETEYFDSEHYYLIPDYESDQDAVNIIENFGKLRLLTGGSGLLQFWGEALFNKNSNKKGIILAGSCSKATLEQIQVYKDAGNPLYKINPLELLGENNVKENIIRYVNSNQDGYVLVYSSDTADKVKQTQKYGKDRIAGLIERLLSEIALELVNCGYRNIIVAGGETSGAVTKKLGYSAFEIGDSVAPGVPIMKPIDNKDVKLVLKSGNFGQPDFFERAAAKTAGVN